MLGRTIADVVCLQVMRETRAKSEASTCVATESALAKSLAPEDVRAGDFVATLSVTFELPSFFWHADSYRIPHDQPVRLQLIPEASGQPLKVLSVCLPFVCVKDAAGETKTLDLRKHRVARLCRRYARTVWKAQKKNRPKPLWM